MGGYVMKRRMLALVLCTVLIAASVALAPATGAAATLAAGTAPAYHGRMLPTQVPLSLLLKAQGAAARRAGDDDIPGVALPPVPVNDTLDASTDPVDVYAVEMQAGQYFMPAIIAADNTKVGLVLCKPGTTTWTDQNGWVDIGVAAGSGSIDLFYPYQAPESGTYYLACVMVEGAGSYQLLYGFPTDKPTLTLSGAASIPYGGAAKLSAKLTVGGSPRAEEYVYLYQKPLGATKWTYVTYGETNASGACTFVPPADKPNIFKIKIKTSYMASYDGSFDVIPGESAAKAVTPKAYVGNPVAPTTMSKTKYYTVYGYLKPRHTAGSACVRIYKYRYVSGRWRAYGYVNAKASNYSSYSKYAVSMRLPYAGRWRLRAYHGDSGHAASWSSGYDYVTVR